MNAPMSFSQLRAYHQDKERCAREELKQMLLEHGSDVRQWLDELEREIEDTSTNDDQYNCPRHERRP